MNDAFRNFDSWLEGPIQRHYAEQDRYEAAVEDFCKAEGFDPEDHDSPAFQDAFAAWQQEQEDRAEDAAIERYLERGL